VIVLVDEMIAHMRESAALPPVESLVIETRHKPTMPPEWYIPYSDPGTGVPPMSEFGSGYR